MSPRIARTLALWVALCTSGCAARDGSAPVVLRFWAMGREGEVVQELTRDFEAANPGIRVQVQQIPWTAAHEKLLTAYVGGSTPDLAQLGNTWVPEFSTLRALEPLDRWVRNSDVVDSAAFFPGIWHTNIIEGTLYGLPWYVDTRVLFYRKDLLAQAGYTTIPQDWAAWRASMVAVKKLLGPDHYAILLPTNEWNQPAIFGLQAGSPLLTDDATRGAFRQPAFRRAFRFLVDLYHDDLAPPVANTEIANVYQEFARGYFAMYITGPWNLGEFRRRLPPELQDAWATAPLPGPDGAASGLSFAGGSSLAMFEASRHKEQAWRLMEFLTRPDQQLRFLHLSGDLPARREAWQDTALTGDPRITAFGQQLERVVPVPKVPEWEFITTRLLQQTESAVRAAAPIDSVLATLDREVDRILEKRRWLVQRQRERGHPPQAAAQSNAKDPS